MDGRFTVGASVVREGHEGRRRDEALEAKEVFHMYQRKAMSESPKTSLFRKDLYQLSPQHRG